MPIIQQNVTQDAESVAPSAGQSGFSFAPLQAGYYTAIIRKVEEGTYRAGYGSYKSQADDGKFTYVKIRPHVQVLVPNGELTFTYDEDGNEVPVQSFSRTLINRNDLTVGVLNEDGTAFIRPDGDKEKSAIFSSLTGAFFFMKEAGMYRTDDNGSVSLVFDVETVFDRVLRIKVANAAYCKATKQNWSSEAWAQWVSDNVIPDGDEATVEEVIAAVDAVNEAEGYEDGEGIRLKNVVVGWYSLSRAEAERLGFWFDEATNLTFENEGALDLYNVMLDMNIGDDEAF
jgi:hypothetical protein